MQIFIALYHFYVYNLQVMDIVMIHSSPQYMGIIRRRRIESVFEGIW